MCNYFDNLEEFVRRNKKEIIKADNLIKGNINKSDNLVPICANCKKIRDDSGLWQAYDSNSQNLLMDKLSHGMCPECAEKFYSGKKWYKKMKENRKKNVS